MRRPAGPGVRTAVLAFGGHAGRARLSMSALFGRGPLPAIMPAFFGTKDKQEGNGVQDLDAARQRIAALEKQLVEKEQSFRRQIAMEEALQQQAVTSLKEVQEKYNQARLELEAMRSRMTADPDESAAGTPVTEETRRMMQKRLEATERNLAQIIDASVAAEAKVLLLGMQMPPNYGPVFTKQFAEVYKRLGERPEVSLVPFFLEGVGDQPDLIQADGIHPTAEAQPRLLDNVWPYLEPLLD